MLSFETLPNTSNRQSIEAYSKYGFKPYLQIDSILKIFCCIVFDRRDTTTPEDFFYSLKWLGSPIFYLILKELSYSICLNHVFKATQLINCLIQSFKNKSRYVEYQQLLMNHSTLLLRHIELIMQPGTKRQRQWSVLFLYHCLIENLSGCHLMTRLVPKPLFRHVDSTSNDISKWTLIQWEELFQKVGQDFKTATEQWNDDCRKELIQNLRDSQTKFNSNWKKIEWNVLETTLNEISNSNQAGGLEGSKISEILQLRWNFEEFSVNYRVLEQKLPIWKYYIQELYLEEEHPKLLVPLDNPKKLWEEMIVRFISTESLLEKKKILEAMVLVYTEYYDKIKELSIIPYFVKILEGKEFPHLEYIILQLIYASLCVSDPILANTNRMKFHKTQGIRQLRFIIASNYHFEDLDHFDYEKEKDNFEKNKNLRENQNQNNFEVVFNYTSASIIRESYNDELLRSNKIIFSLLIIKICIVESKSQTEDYFLYPRPYSQDIIMTKPSIELICQLLMMKDQYVVIATLEIIKHSYLDKFSFEKLLERANFFEKILLNISQFNAEIVAYNIRELFFLLDWQSTGKTREIMQDIARLGYINKNMRDEYSDENSEAFSFRESVSFSIVNLMPVNLLHILIKNVNQFFIRDQPSLKKFSLLKITKHLC